MGLDEQMKDRINEFLANGYLTATSIIKFLIALSPMKKLLLIFKA